MASRLNTARRKMATRIDPSLVTPEAAARAAKKAAKASAKKYFELRQREIDQQEAAKKAAEELRERQLADANRAASDPFAEFPEPTRSRHELMQSLHTILEPRTYLEVGVQTGLSLALSRCRTVGVDPAFVIDNEVSCDLQLHRATSDDFFARPDSVAFFEGAPVDLAFIDGMHLSDFALRDFINVEKLMSRSGVVILDDMLPRNSLEAARDRRTSEWTGDVYKVAEILRRLRPDLHIIDVNTSPTGTVLIIGLDPDSTVLADTIDESMDYCLKADPQDVPADTLHRTRAVDPAVLMSAPEWRELAALRTSSPDADQLNAVLAALAVAGRPAAL